ncbi:MAG TPA: hypothetical protein VGB50_03000 [Flavobacterium sp.]|jgi:hypothetical protein
MLFFALNENPFKQERREFPVDFAYPTEDKYAITIALPEGYTVETVPQPLIYNMKGLGAFKYNIQANQKTVQLSVVFEINSAIVSPQHYDSLKSFFKEVIDKQNERIVLKKV